MRQDPRLVCLPSTRGDRGYALVAAVAAILFFAVVALGVLTITRRAVTTGTAEIESARANAAADAGIVLGVRGLLANGPREAFPIDGTVRRLRFADTALEIAATDERGKVPINLLDEQQIDALLQYAGLAGDPLIIARDSYLDWIDDDDEARPNGAEYDYYRTRQIKPRNSGFVTVGELARVRGFSPAVVFKIAAIATTDFGSGSFEATSASPAAIRIMYPDGDAAVTEIVRSREAQGQTTALGFDDRSNRTGHPILIVAKATLPTGATAVRRCIVELTGAARRPYVVRNCAT